MTAYFPSSALLRGGEVELKDPSESSEPLGEYWREEGKSDSLEVGEVGGEE